MSPTTIKIVSIGGATGQSKLYRALQHILSWTQLLAESPGDIKLRRISSTLSRKLNRALLQFHIEATALVGTWDSGGSTGQLRSSIGASGGTADVTKIYGVLANPEGFANRLLRYAPLLCQTIGKTFGIEAVQALYDLAGIDPAPYGDLSLRDRLLHRYSSDDPRPILRGNTIQNMTAVSLWKQLQSEKKGLQTYHELIGAPEEFQVLPLAWESTTLGVIYRDRTEGWDEATIDQRPEKDWQFDPHFHRIRSYQLKPPISISSDADEAIRTADILICPPGSVANQGGAFQVGGVKEAVLNRFGRSQKEAHKTETILIMNLSAAPPDSHYDTALTLKERVQGIYGIAFDNIICNNEIIPAEIFHGCEEPLDILGLVEEALVMDSRTSYLFTNLVSEESLKQGRAEHDPYLLALTLIPLFATVAARKRATQRKSVTGTLA